MHFGIVKQPEPSHGKRGSKRGEIARFLLSVLELYPEVDRLIQNGRQSLRAALKHLAEKGRIDGQGTSTQPSRIARLGKVFSK
jgi:hypothetical protein